MELTETSPELEEAMRSTLDSVFGAEPTVGALHTGGGMMVLVVDLDVAGNGRQIWLTREDEKTWMVGFYDFAADEEDEGIVVTLDCPRDYSYDRELGEVARSLADSPWFVASRVAGIVQRLGVDLRGEA